jgi:hypothetical protein
MRLSVVLLLCSLAGVLGGGALIGLPALGGCLIFDALCVGVYALLRDNDDVPAAPTVRTLQEFLREKARAS